LPQPMTDLIHRYTMDTPSTGSFPPPGGAVGRDGPGDGPGDPVTFTHMFRVGPS